MIGPVAIDFLVAFFELTMYRYWSYLSNMRALILLSMVASPLEFDERH